jgi:xylulose-5-phosphate/fructose-6-phosphate phosphoketolase
MDVVDRLPQTGAAGISLKIKLQKKLVEHRQYINEFGNDMPEIRNWTWSATSGKPA